MAQQRDNQVSAPSRDYWNRRLHMIPSAYGQMVFLARLLNPDTGQYEDYSSDEGSRHDTHLLLRSLHEAVFRSWISLPLSAKMADIELYISGIECAEPAEIIDAWLRLTPYKNLVPGTIQGPERYRHTSDLEVILGLLQNVHGVPNPDRS